VWLCLVLNLCSQWLDWCLQPRCPVLCLSSTACCRFGCITVDVSQYMLALAAATTLPYPLGGGRCAACVGCSFRCHARAGCSCERRSGVVITSVCVSGSLRPLAPQLAITPKLASSTTDSYIRQVSAVKVPSVHIGQRQLSLWSTTAQSQVP
jgi:hypothetical protein